MIDDRAELRRRGTLICQRLAADVEKITPAGIGRWERAWKIVGNSSADFMIAIAAWEAEPDEKAQDQVRAAYRVVLDAWRRAVAEWERQGAER